MNTLVKRRLFLGIAILLFIGSSMLVQPMVRSREQYDLTSNPVRGASPHLVLATNVFGWARGVIMDVIWIRMHELQQEGRHFEVNQLAEWACQLSPRVPEIWDIQGWNMAYNVSCTLEYMPDRWAWVWAGVELLRNKAIPNNPNAYDLYWSLAWTLFHKIGQQDDNAHFLYKERFALEMQDLLGGRGDWATLVLLDAAPTTSKAMMEDPDVRALVEECAKFDDFDLLSNFFAWYHHTQNVSDRTRDLLDLSSEKRLVPDGVAEHLAPLDVDFPELSEEQSERVFRRTQEVANERNPQKSVQELEGVPQGVSDWVRYIIEARLPLGVTGVPAEYRDKIIALKKIEVFARAQRLTKEYKMQPSLMLGVVRGMLTEARDVYEYEVARKDRIEGDPTTSEVPEYELIAVLEDFANKHVSELPVDWRSPYPHAMYWSQLGLEKVNEAEQKRRMLEREYGYAMAAAKLPGEAGMFEEAEGIFDFPRIQLVRTFYFSMQSLVQHGRIMFDTEGGFLYDVGPEYRLAGGVLPILDDIFRQRLDFDLGKRMRAGPEQGYLSFLERAIAELHFLGEDDESRKYYNLLKRRFPKRTYNHDTFPEYLRWRVTDFDSSMTFDAARNRLRGLLLNALKAWAVKDEEDYAHWDGRARKFVIDYYENDGIGEVEKRGLVLYNEIAEGVVVDMLAGVYLGSEKGQALREKLKERLSKHPDWRDRYQDLVDKAARKAAGHGKIEKYEPMPRYLRVEGYKTGRGPDYGMPDLEQGEEEDEDEIDLDF